MNWYNILNVYIVEEGCLKVLHLLTEFYFFANFPQKMLRILFNIPTCILVFIPFSIPLPPLSLKYNFLSFQQNEPYFRKLNIGILLFTPDGTNFNILIEIFISQYMIAAGKGGKETF